MTVREFRLRAQGYYRMLNEQRRNARWVGYQTLLMNADPEKLPPMEDVWPIDGDPTKEEKEAALERKKVEDLKWRDDLVASMIAKGTLKTNKNWKKDSK